MASEPAPFAPEDLALLERVAARVVELHLEVPAVLTLESVRPLSFVAGQAMVFFQPLVQALLRFDDYGASPRLLERRETLELLTSLDRAPGRGAAGARCARAAGGEAMSPAERGALPQDVRSILATDCGSTTTKAILIERREDGYRLVARGEAPTTVEAPFEDVTRGVLNAVREVEELRGPPAARRRRAS